MEETKRNELVRLLETVSEMNEKQVEILSVFVQGMMSVKVCVSE